MFDMYCLKSSVVPVHIMKISSMNLFHLEKATKKLRRRRGGLDGLFNRQEQVVR